MAALLTATTEPALIDDLATGTSGKRFLKRASRNFLGMPELRLERSLVDFVGSPFRGVLKNLIGPLAGQQYSPISDLSGRRRPHIEAPLTLKAKISSTT
jgi:hypothetical protein